MTRDLNLTIFICHMMRLCHDVAIYCSSVDCQGSLAVEWCDFFKPALQESLLSVFLNNSSPLLLLMLLLLVLLLLSLLFFLLLLLLLLFFLLFTTNSTQLCTEKVKH